MESHIKTSKNFNVSDVSFGTMKILDTGGRMIYLSYGGNPIYLQTPANMSTPFGLSSWTGDGGGSSAPVKYSIELSFKNRETSVQEARFFELLQEFDRKIVSTVLENSALWLKKKYNSLEVLEALYTPCVKFPKDRTTGEVTDKYSPTFRVNVPFRDSKFQCDTYDMLGNKLDLSANESSTKGGKVTVIMQCAGIWIAGGKFGCTWRAMQIRLKPSDSLPPCAFADDGEFDDECFDQKLQKKEEVPVAEKVEPKKEPEVEIEVEKTPEHEPEPEVAPDEPEVAPDEPEVAPPEIEASPEPEIPVEEDVKTPKKKSAAAKKK